MIEGNKWINGLLESMKVTDKRIQHVMTKFDRALFCLETVENPYSEWR